MDNGADSAAETPEPTSTEVARLAAERDRLEAEAGDLQPQVATAPPRPGGRPRRIATALLVVVTSIVFTVAVVGVWARRNVLNTDKWVETVGPIAEDPAVKQALGGIGAGIVVLLVVDLSWLGILVLALVIGGFELAVVRIAGPTPGRGEPQPRGAAEPP